MQGITNSIVWRWRGSRITITAPSHVHAGNPDLHGGYGRLYGTLGIALEKPRLKVEASDERGGCECPSDALEIYRMLSRRYECTPRIIVRESIPRHVGLGSTTPLYISIANIFDVLCNDNRGNPIEYAILTGRAGVSGLGLYSYIHGGVLYDGGFDIERPGIPPLVYRGEPPGWARVLVVLPRKQISKILELKKKEDEILSSLPKMDPKAADKASRILLIGVISNAAAGDWRKAFHYLGVFNKFLGTYWSRFQGGVYCCREVEGIIEELYKLGALGAGQSSWGPTAYGIFDSREIDLDKVKMIIEELLNNIGGGEIWISKIASRGAMVRIQ